MLSDPLVSIIVPVFNASKYITETLNCALEQSYSNTEIIVVDDGSTDNSLEIIKAFTSNKIRVIEQPNRGGNVARNRGLTAAKGDFIQFLDADDLMDEDKISAQIKRLVKEPEGTVAFCPWQRFLQRPQDTYHGQSPNWKDFADPVDWVVEHLKGRAMMPPVGWLTPRSVINQAGPWNESLIINQDGEFFHRVVLNATKLVCTNSVTIYYRSGIDTSVSQQKGDGIKYELYNSMKHIIEYSLRHASHPELRPAIAFYLHKFVRSTYPRVPELVSEVEKYALEFGPMEEDQSFGKKPSPVYQLVEKILGWKIAAQIKALIRS